MDWPYEIAERDHDVQNPTSVEKLRLLGDYLRLGSENRVIDVACGKGGLASTDDDRDRYESLHWRALEEWLDFHANAHEIRTKHERYRHDYLAFRRALLGWAIFVGRRS